MPRTSVGEQMKPSPAMKPWVIVIQHEPREGPGSLARLLPPGTRIVRAWEEEIPAEASRLLLLGGGMSVSDDLPFLRAEKTLIQRCVLRGVPVLGLCLGSQLLAAALGGTVSRAPRKEIGFYRVRLLPQAQLDPVCSPSPSDFVAFHWHGDAFSLPPGAVPLAASTMTPLQAFRFGDRAWGLQFHPEMDMELLTAFIETGAADLAEAGVAPDALLTAATRELPRLAQIAAPLFLRFLAVP
jgi:GMP synthase (glutamine-hydrolysing)